MELTRQRHAVSGAVIVKIARALHLPKCNLFTCFCSICIFRCSVGGPWFLEYRIISVEHGFFFSVTDTSNVLRTRLFWTVGTLRDFPVETALSVHQDQVAELVAAVESLMAP